MTTPRDPSAVSVGNSAPPLPTSATHEERERHWYQHIYQGNQQRQLTLRALVMGAALGLLMSLSNLYTTVKLGWSFGVAVTASVLSFLLWNSLRMLSGGRIQPLSLLESNCMQSTASSAGYSTGSTVALCFGASLLASGTHYPWYVLAPFVLCTAGMGVFLAIPMKRQLVNREQLPFPTGTAAAETLRSLYGKSREAMSKAYALLGGLGLGMLIGGLRTYGTFVTELAKTPWRQSWLEALQKRWFITDEIPLVGILNPLSRGQMAGLSLEPSVLLVGAGMIMGARVCLSMVFGAVLLYYVAAPLMLAYDVSHAQIAGYVPAFRLNPQGGFNPVRWGLWGGASLMVFASLTALALDWRTLGRAFQSLGSQRDSNNDQRAREIEVPNSWFFLGFIPFALGMVLLLRLTFQVSVPLGLFAVALSAIVSLVCARVTGETDTTPMGAMGKVTQLLYAILPGSAGNATINLMTAGATTGAGLSSADLLQDLKSGHLLGANPRQQFWAQFAGIFVGVLGVVPCWYLMFPTKEALERFNPPAVNMWKAVSDVLTQGIQTLPSTALWLISLGAILGILLPTLERLFPRAKSFLPSATGLGLSWVVVFQNSLSIGIGAGAVWLWSRFRQQHADAYGTPIASGFIAGESLTAAFIAIGCTLLGLLAKN